jgi:hypothetical protein
MGRREKRFCKNADPATMSRMEENSPGMWLRSPLTASAESSRVTLTTRWFDGPKEIISECFGVDSILSVFNDLPAAYRVRGERRACSAEV